MAEANRTGLIWRTSSLSGAENCVEVALADTAVLVRDSRDRSGPMLMVGKQEWADFLDGVRNGEFGRD